MKKLLMIFGLAMALVLPGCADSSRETTADTQDSGETGAPASEQTPLRAVYLENDQGFLFVDLGNETPFTGSLPQDITDESGNALAEDDLNSGDVFDVYGDGIMTMSYPGQYPGITGMVRVEAENADYVSKYQELMDQFLAAPDMSEPPQLSLSYSQSNASVTAICDRFGYIWEYTDENGETQAVAVDSIHVLQSDALVQHSLEGDTTVTVLSEPSPESITVTCWEAGQRQDSMETIPEGTAVDVASGENGLSFTARPGYIYSIDARWPEGEVTFGFEAVASGETK